MVLEDDDGNDDDEKIATETTFFWYLQNLLCTKQNIKLTDWELKKVTVRNEWTHLIKAQSNQLCMIEREGSQLLN